MSEARYNPAIQLLQAVGLNPKYFDTSRYGLGMDTITMQHKCGLFIRLRFTGDITAPEHCELVGCHNVI